MGCILWRWKFQKKLYSLFHLHLQDHVELLELARIFQGTLNQWMCMLPAMFPTQ